MCLIYETFQQVFLLQTANQQESKVRVVLRESQSGLRDLRFVGEGKEGNLGRGKKIVCSLWGKLLMLIYFC